MDVIIFFVVSMGMASVPISLDYVLQLMWQKNNRTKKSSWHSDSFTLHL